MAYIRFLETRLNWDPVRKYQQIVDSVKRILLEVGRWWMQTCFEGHFVPMAVPKYGYPLRTPKYMIRKARKWHHQRPLIWSGAFYAAAKTGTLSAAKKGKDIGLKLLFRGGFTNRKTGRNVRQDLFARSPAEEDHIQHHIRLGCLGFIRKPEPGMKPVSRMGA